MSLVLSLLAGLVSIRSLLRRLVEVGGARRLFLGKDRVLAVVVALGTRIC